jgi:uncharacterized C2H2 Zn-finger protein
MIFENFEKIYLILLVLFFLVVPVYKAYKKKRRKITLHGSSVLLAYYTDGKQLFSAKRGTVENMHYSAIITTNIDMLLYRIELPFASKYHIVSIPKASDVTQIDPTGGDSIMEKVHLEGDFPDYFSIFAQKDQQSGARYVLDPKAMAFTIDFCRSHNWELINNELYFLQANANNKNDKTAMFDDITTFIKEIRPAVERPISDRELMLSTPYNEDRRRDLKCPLCHAVMNYSGDYFVCPKNHGILITGKDLAQVTKGNMKVIIDQPLDEIVNEHNLQCPSCSNILKKIKYNWGQEIIDSCTSCAYRWLDSHEIAKLIR